MTANTMDSTPEKRPAWRRRIGVFACLLALMAVLFGHIEVPAAAPPDALAAAIMTGHVDGAADHDAGSAPQHCMHQGQCIVQAILPSPLLPDAFGALRTRLAADLRGASRAISPHRHPPKSFALL